METKHAGIGTLLIRVHGLKDAFKIEASPVSDKDQRTLLAHYSPKIPGEYTIFVRWSGVHIPGSPFTVHISRRQGEYSCDFLISFGSCQFLGSFPNHPCFVRNNIN